MISFLYNFVFLIISLYILGNTIGYGLYEIKKFNNKQNGIIIIVLSVLVVIFANFMMWLN